jgi:HEPN domain-containing protein
MKDLKLAQSVLKMAHKDFKALRGMMNAEVFDEEIFGFHAQQASEKCLKSWLAFLGKEYPLTHDLTVLLELLRAEGQNIERYWGLVELNAYGVRFRYESHEIYDEALDRPAAIQSVEALMTNVQRLLNAAL